MANNASIRCGPFVLVEKIDEGGMAQVWRAEHVRRGELAAVKIVTGLASQPELETRFAEEVRTHANLRHPAIVRVFDQGRVNARTAIASDGSLHEGQQYLAMEFADRGTVRDLVPPPDWAMVAALIRSLLDGLAYIHARDLVHRDLKPENILLVSETDAEADEGEAPVQFKLADFGITHAFDALESRGDEGLGLEDDYFSQDAGTPVYMAPEQFFGKWQRFGPWTDLYQLGTILWELVCGEPPFQADNPYSYGYSHSREPLPEFEPRVPPPEGFRAWLGALLAKAPEDRFQRAADAAWHFEKLEPQSNRATPTGEAALSDADRDGSGPRATTVLDQRVPTLAFLETSRETERSAETGLDGLASPSKVTAATQRMTRQTPPPVAEDWRAPELAEPAPTERDAGLGLFGVRDVPMVDRDEIRDAMWSHLRAVVEEEASRVVILEGPSGVGKSRLARWLAQRAHEAGVVTPLRAQHEERSEPRRGLVDLVERYFRVWGESRAETHSMVVEILDAVAGSAPSTSREDLEFDARAYTELLRPTKPGASFEGPEFLFHSERYLYSALTQLLAYVGTRRPPLVWLDDVQWGLDSLTWVDWYLERSERPPALFVLTLETTDGDPGRETIGRWRERRCRDERVECLHVEPFGRERHGRLVDRTLPLEAEMANRVRDATEGNPLFAGQAIGTWVYGEKLVLDGGVFGPANGAELEVPSSLHAAWLERLEAALAAATGEDREAAWRGLEVAAAFGTFVSAEKWEAAMEHLEPPPPDSLLKTLADVGLVESAAGGWEFAHSTLADALESRARRERRWRDHQVVCADILEDLESAEISTHPALRARFLAEAGELEEAIDLFLEAAEGARRIEDFDRMLDVVGQVESLLDRLGAPSDDERRLQAMLLRGRERLESAPSELEGMISRIDAQLEPGEAVELAGRLRLLESRLLQLQGRLDAASECVDGTIERLVEEESFEIAANLVEERGNALHRMGDYDGATSAYERADSLYRRTGRRPRRARRLRLLLGQLAVEDDQFAEAERRFERTIRRAREAGDLETLLAARNSMGESKRYQGKWEEANSYYRRAMHWYDRLGYERQSTVARLNVVLAKLGARQYDHARSMLEEMADRLRSPVARIVRPTAAAAWLVCRAAEGEWSEWDRARDELERALAESDYRHRDQPKYAEFAAELAIRAGRYERAADLLATVRDLWTLLGDEEAVERVRGRLGKLEA